MRLPWKRRDLLQVWTWPQLFCINSLCWWAESMSPLRLFPLFRVIRGLMVVWLTLFQATITASFCLSMAEGQVDLFTLFQIVPSFIGTLGAHAMIRHGAKIKKSMDILDSLLKEAHSEIDSRLEKFIRQKYFKLWVMTLVIVGGSVFLSVEWNLIPFLISVTTNQKLLIARTWPQFTDNWWQITLAALQAVGVHQIGLSVGVVPSMYASVSEGILIQFEVLKMYFNKVNYSEGKNERLRASIVRHQRILKVCYLLRDSTKEIIIFQTMLTSLELCVGVFEILYDRNAGDKVLQNVAQTAVLHLSLMFLYSWYSSEIIHKSRDVVTDLYESHWENWTVMDRKSLMIVALAAQKPLVFGGIVNVNLDTFINVIKTGFTYYNFITAVKI